VNVSVETTKFGAQMLNGQRIAIVGKLAGMSRRDVEQLIRERGGQVVPQIDADTNMVVLSDDAGDFARFAGAADLLDDSARLAWQDGRLEFVRETEFWALLGLVDADQHVHRLYTPAMLAELLKVPVQAIRHWHRKGRLIAVRRVGRLPYFDFDEVQVGRRLVALLNAGCSLSTVDRKLDELSRLQPQLRRPLADANVVIAGNRLCLRQGEAISEPTGQLMIDFDTVDDPIADRDNESKSTIPFSMAAANSVTLSTSIEPDESADTDELRSLVMKAWLALNPKVYSFNCQAIQDKHEKQLKDKLIDVQVEKGKSLVYRVIDKTGKDEEHQLILKNKKTLKGVSKAVVENEIAHDHYEKVYETNEPLKRHVTSLRSFNHNVVTYRAEKVALTSFYDKMRITDANTCVPVGYIPK